MILCDRQIKELALQHDMIFPYTDGQIAAEGQDEGVISYGQSSFGYDIRLGTSFRFLHSAFVETIDPKDFSRDTYIKKDTEKPFLIAGNSFTLGVSLERIKVPRNVMVIAIGKSTYARCGIITNVTPLEPGWEGYITIEITNSAPAPAKIYPREGICQLLFLAGETPDLTYADRKGGGKYQNQVGVTLPRV